MTIEIPTLLKFAISAIWDILDFTIFRLPGFGTFADFVSIPLAYALWGNLGLLATWELADLTDNIDGFVPTLTIIGIMQFINEGDKENIKQIIRRPTHV